MKVEGSVVHDAESVPEGLAVKHDLHRKVPMGFFRFPDQHDIDVPAQDVGLQDVIAGGRQGGGRALRRVR
ncbi:hypothetical protein D3C87_1901360 [compost metagenome]